MEITLRVPDALGRRLKPMRKDLPTILELGVRELDDIGPGYAGISKVIELLATLPSAEEVLALRPSRTLQARVRALVEKSKTRGLSGDEEREWGRYEYLEHVVRMAKARALLKVKRKASQ